MSFTHRAHTELLRNFLSRELEIQFGPPRYLSLPTAGIDLSVSGVKVVTLVEKGHGLELELFKDVQFPVTTAPGVVGQQETSQLIARAIAGTHIKLANTALRESRGYLFEATVEGTTPAEWRTKIEQKLDEYVPLPPAEVAFDSVPFHKEGNVVQLVGIGCARRVIDETLSTYQDAGVMVRAIEGEPFALPRALLPHGSTETVLIIDIGKSSTKLLVVTSRLPRFATTLDIGGHALTLAVQKYFGVTEEQAKQVKLDSGLVPGQGNDEYVAAMLSTVSVIRDEILKRVEYWNSRQTTMAGYEKISRALLVGGNASIRGLPEYLETALKVPVELADVFTNFASREHWLPPLDYTESLAYGTAIGLALREYVP
jgi:type IV pilus assembly protein PilM